MPGGNKAMTPGEADAEYSRRLRRRNRLAWAALACYGLVAVAAIGSVVFRTMAWIAFLLASLVANFAFAALMDREGRAMDEIAPGRVA